LPDDRAQLAPGGKSILIVEDDLAFARILVDFVRARGYAALVAHDGDSGCALAREYMPSAVLLDVMLPRTDGWEAMHRLRHDPRTRDIPVHFISCLDAWQRAMDLGAVGFVTKPVNAEQLEAVFDTIERALAQAVKRLLLVEDSPDAARSLAALMSERGALVTLAASGAQALDLLQQERFECMVLDLGLPDMPGYEVLTHIQSNQALRAMPVIIHSGQDLDREQLKELNRYAESVIVKGPTSPERLLNEVTLFLHMVESKRVPALAPSAHDDASLSGRKVLLVDDDMRNIFSLTSLLTEWGMVVVEAENGAEALVRLAEHPDVSVVLMDIMMPQMDGYSAMRAIRAGQVAPTVPIIAMTAKAMQGDQQKCLDAGASDYLAKPLDTEKLLSMLRVWCS
jgi:CheY-like chemotaxis protein